MAGSIPQWVPPTDRPALRRIEVSAPAKVNLFLGVHAHEADDAPSSRHLTDNVMHTISLADTLVARVVEAESPDDEDALTVVCSPDVGVPQEENLVWRAVWGLARRIGRTSVVDEPGCQLEVRVSKQVPAQAGLGGGSADAAAAIVAASRLWGIDPLGEDAVACAQSLGSDVPFFLYGGAARMDGCGERLAERLPALEGALVIVKPGAGVSTGACYQEFDRAPEALPAYGPLTRALRMPDDSRHAASRLAHAALAMDNNLAPAAFRLLPELAEVVEWLAAQPRVLAAQLTGSGSASFGICGTDEVAYQVARQAQARGWYAMPAWFVPQGARVVDDRRRP